MKLAVMSESEADEAALRILIEASIGSPVDVDDAWRLRVRPGGWVEVLKNLPAQLMRLHYNSDVDALVAVIDADDTASHQLEHDRPGADVQDCRLCGLRRTATETMSTLRPRIHYPPLKIAFGVPVPAIEAWYRCGLDQHNTEVEWARRLQNRGTLKRERDQLKLSVYGTNRPSIEMETAYAISSANRLANMLGDLERYFPGGFGTLARTIRTW